MSLHYTNEQSGIISYLNLNKQLKKTRTKTPTNSMGKLTKHTQIHLKCLALTFIDTNILIKLKIQNKLWKTSASNNWWFNHQGNN